MDLNTYIVTFNAGRKQIDVDFFAAHLFDALSSQHLPDLLVFCLQEAAPIAYSFLNYSMWQSYAQRFETAVSAALRGYGAEEQALRLVQVHNVGMTAIKVFAKQHVIERIARVDTAGVGVGLWDMGNKGAAGVRLWLSIDAESSAVPVTFVAAHLAPMESAWERRNADWRAICERLVFTQSADSQQQLSRQSEEEPLLEATDKVDASQESDMFTPASPLFFAGDLNYRTSDAKPDENAHIAWPTADSSIKVFSTLLEQDQLSRERLAGKTLHHMDEADISFPPSYKYSSTAQKQATDLAKTSGSSKSTGSLWAQHRIPSWCDRVLFLEDESMNVHSYTTLPIQPTSDHRPVALSATISLQDATAKTIKNPFSIDTAWQSKRATARTLETMVGFGAYLTLTYEGKAILISTFIGMVCCAVLVDLAVRGP